MFCNKKTLGVSLMLSVLMLLMAGCVSRQSPYNYDAFIKSRPKSILVLPPVNNTVDINATYGLYSQVSYPLAEDGYYVFPVALVDETFKQNGVTSPAEIQNIPYDKLYNIFGADAALYITVTNYGVKYHIIRSDVVVSANARLIDLRSGQQLWDGSASASNQENSNGSGNLIVDLIAAVVMQVANNLGDKSYDIAGIASNRLLFAGYNGGLLYGPRSPFYMQ